ncbi:MAG: hypothetical protein QOK24_2070 [Verrucomicrobiota bacterium]|jgi:hypothetical protein
MKVVPASVRAIAAITLLIVRDPVAAQTRPGAEFQLTKITKNLISTPQFAYTGCQFTIRKCHSPALRGHIELMARNRGSILEKAHDPIFGQRDSNE